MLNFFKTFSAQILGSALTSSALLLAACGPSAQTSSAISRPEILIQPATRAVLSSVRARHGISVQQARLLTMDTPPPEQMIPAPQADQAGECADFRKQLPVDYFQDFIVVPENWDDPLIVNGDYSNPNIVKIKVFYYGKNIVPGKIPVVFFNGGPGSDSHSSFQVLDQDQTVLARPERAQLTFVYLDQRGTGCSDPYPSGISQDTLNRLIHYGSRGIVRDAEALRVKLLGANGQWKAFGQSYGGYIVHRYAMIAPDHLAGAYAHGSSLMDDQEKWLRLRILSQKRVQDDYFVVHPEDKAGLATIRSLIPTDQCYTDGTAHICGPDVMDAMTIELGFQTSWDDMHGWIQGLLTTDAQGKTQIAQTQLLDFLRYFTFGEYDDSGFMSGVIGNYEMSPGLNELTACPQVNSEIKQETGDDPLNWPINECRLLGNTHDTFDALVLGMTQFDPMLVQVFHDDVQTHPSLKFHLYSGQKDVFVPIETFTDEVQKLGNLISYTNFPTTGHDGFYTEQKVWQDLTR